MFRIIIPLPKIIVIGGKYMPKFPVYILDDYRVSLAPSENTRSILFFTFKHAIPSYTWGDDIWFDLNVSSNKTLGNTDILNYSWVLCDKYEKPSTINECGVTGNDLMNFEVVPNKKRKTKKWEDGSIHKNSKTNYFKYHAVHIGYIPDLERYNLVVKITHKNGKNELNKPMAIFRITDLEDKNDRDWDHILGLLFGIIGTLIGAILVYVFVR
jgi:hypothetical protein